MRLCSGDDSYVYACVERTRSFAFVDDESLIQCNLDSLAFVSSVEASRG